MADLDRLNSTSAQLGMGYFDSPLNPISISHRTPPREIFSSTTWKSLECNDVRLLPADCNAKSSREFPSVKSRITSGIFSSMSRRTRPSAVGPTRNVDRTLGSETLHNTPLSVPCLREALHSLDSKMALMSLQRELLESHLEQAVHLHSPICRLPNEILSSIFVIGVMQSVDEDPIIVSTLMLVCRKWATIAVETPSLWSSIAVSPHDSFDSAQLKLSRSKSVPIDVTINFGRRSEPSSGVLESIISAVDLFRRALWRTKSLYLNVPTQSQANAILARCREEAPILETLSIHVFHCIQEDPYSSPPLPLFGGHSPRLRVCSFNSFNFGWDVNVVSQLRVLELGGYLNESMPSVDSLFDILQECPNLEELTLRNMSDVDAETCFPDEDPDPPKILRLPRLMKATFYCTGIIRTRMLMGHISCPALVTLKFCYLDNLTPVLHHLKSQALTSLPLRHLRIESCSFVETKLVELLRCIHSLVKLELVDCEDASSNLLKMLSRPSPSQPWLCPKFEDLNVDGCPNIPFAALRSFVESRLPPSSTSPPATACPYTRSKSLPTPLNHLSPIIRPPRLRCIDVTRCHQLSKEMVQWLRVYVPDVRCEPAKGGLGGSTIP